MTWLLLGLLLVSLGGLIAYMWREAPPKPVDPEAAMRAAVELHRIGRQLDAAWLKTQQRQGASRLRRDIADALDDDER
jgi:hypothetical protein